MRVVVVQENKSVKVEQRPIPKPKDHEILLKILCVGQNPTDFKHVDSTSKPGNWLGCDFVGEVTELGSAVPKDQVKHGEIRWSFIRGGREEKGAFAEYVTTDWDLTSIVPQDITPQQAASLPIPLLTAVQAFYLPSRLALPEPPVQSPSKQWILIWSGATAVGRFAIQLAKLSGLRVAVTASPKRWDLVKSLGADVAVDYKDPDVVQKLKDATGDAIQYGLDCVVQDGSCQKAQLAFCPEGGCLITVLVVPQNLPRPEVKTVATLVYTGLGGDHHIGPNSDLFKTDPSHRELHAKWAKKIPGLLAAGKIKPLQVEVVGGLETVQEGLNRMRSGKYENKLVHDVSN